MFEKKGKRIKSMTLKWPPGGRLEQASWVQALFILEAWLLGGKEEMLGGGEWRCLPPTLVSLAKQEQRIYIHVNGTI